MFRKRSLSDELFLHFSSKVQNLTMFSIIYMIRIRIRFFGPGDLIQNGLGTALCTTLTSTTTTTTTTTILLLFSLPPHTTRTHHTAPHHTTSLLLYPSSQRRMSYRFNFCVVAGYNGESLAASADWTTLQNPRQYGAHLLSQLWVHVSVCEPLHRPYCP